MIQTKQALAQLKLLQVNKPGETPRNPGIKDTVYLTGHGPINFRLLEKILKTLNQTKVTEFYIQDCNGPDRSGAPKGAIGFFWNNYTQVGQVKVPTGRPSSIIPFKTPLTDDREYLDLALD